MSGINKKAIKGTNTNNGSNPQKRKSEGNPKTAKKQKTGNEEAKSKARTPSCLLSSFTIHKTEIKSSDTLKIDFKFHAFDNPRFEIKLVSKSETQKSRYMIPFSGLQDVMIITNTVNLALSDKNGVQIEQQGSKPNEWLPNEKETAKIFTKKRWKNWS
jgi:hypothetical protein